MEIIDVIKQNVSSEEDNAGLDIKKSNNDSNSCFVKGSMQLKMQTKWNKSWLPEFMSIRYLIDVNNPTLLWNSYTFQW